MRPASSPASAFLIQPAASISAALRSSSCAIMVPPSALPDRSGNRLLLEQLELVVNL
jgi:hypothetical protein